jgi:hypothetical protein
MWISSIKLSINKIAVEIDNTVKIRKSVNQSVIFRAKNINLSS